MDNQQPQLSAFKWLTSWLFILVTLIAMAQTQAGKRVVYYVAWLSVALLVVSHSDQFTGLFGAFGTPPESTIGAPPPGTFPPTGGIPGGKE